MSSGKTLMALTGLAALLMPGCSGGDSNDGKQNATSQSPCSVQFEQDLPRHLVTTMATESTCCGDNEVEIAGSPARLFLARDSDGAGYILYLGKDDKSVLAAQTGPAAWERELYRSNEPEKREGGTVKLTVPRDAMPAGNLRIWADTKLPTTVSGKPLEVTLIDGSTPCAILRTGKPLDPLPQGSYARPALGADDPAGKPGNPSAEDLANETLPGGGPPPPAGEDNREAGDDDPPDPVDPPPDDEPPDDWPGGKEPK